MKKIEKGLVKVGDKTYGCVIIDGRKYVDGKFIDTLLDSLNEEQLLEIATRAYLSKKEISEKN